MSDPTYLPGVEATKYTLMTEKVERAVIQVLLHWFHCCVSLFKANTQSTNHMEANMYVDINKETGSERGRKLM